MRYLCLPLILCLAACSGYKTPSLSGDPARLSADTLCYRAAYARAEPHVQAEIAARRLDCEAILAAQPPIHGRF